MALPEVAPAIGATGLSELERLQATCRRQAMAIDALREAVAGLSCGVRALKEENSELRAERARRRGGGRTATGEDGPPALAEEPIAVGLHAARAARTVASRCLDGRVPSRILADALLLVSELVTNSVLHSGAGEGDEVVVRVHLWRDTCRLEVEDPGCDGEITPRPPGRTDGSGMGLYVVQALSERWGVVRAAGGPTRVWAQLSTGAA